jgi:hypothetical protein
MYEDGRLICSTSTNRTAEVFSCERMVAELGGKIVHPPNAKLSDLRPDIHKNVLTFPPCKELHEGTSLKYITTAISMPDSDLSGITGFNLSGRYPKAVYDETIKTALYAAGKEK